MALINFSLSCCPLYLTAFPSWSITQNNSSSSNSFPKSSSLSLSSSELTSSSSSPSILPKLKRIAQAIIIFWEKVKSVPESFQNGKLPLPHTEDNFCHNSFAVLRMSRKSLFSSAFLARGILTFFYVHHVRYIEAEKNWNKFYL